MLRKLLVGLYITVITCMAAATVMEKYYGSEYVSIQVYGSWWFTALWSLLTAVAVVYFVSRRVRRASTVVLHASFVVILAGALLTHATSWRGVIHLREGEWTACMMDDDGRMSAQRLPFKIRMDSFKIIYHEGTEAAADYHTSFTIKAQDYAESTGQEGSVSMNNIYSYKGVRLYQSSYDKDGRGSYLSVNADPWGIPVTYTGYAMLFISLLWMLVEPDGTFRRLLRSDKLRNGFIMLAVMFGMQIFPLTAEAKTGVNDVTDVGGKGLPPTLPPETARQFGRMYMLYNDRVCPVQTFAIDFTKKLCGHASYRGLSAEQVLAGFILWNDEWCDEAIIRLKSESLREKFLLPEQCSVNMFFNDMSGGYILGPYVKESYEGSADKFHRDVDAVDERLRIIMQLRQGSLLKMFPYTDKITRWYAPADQMPSSMEPEREEYIRNIFAVMREAADKGNMACVDEAVVKIRKYQLRYGGASLPSVASVKAERIYNAVPFATILFILNLTAGLMLLICIIYRLGKSHVNDCRIGSAASCSDTMTGRARCLDYIKRFPYALLLMALSTLALTLCLALRWIISGTVPMTNGYETMLLTAWIVMLLSMLAWTRFRIALAFGFILSGLFLLVSHISLMDPQITYVMPVLSSPLLSLHVSVIMTGFAMLSMTFICGITALVLAVTGKSAGGRLEILRQMSLLFLYPAMAALGFGIFIGAIWANVSWGTYWSWDPKEVWALITFMVYAIALHGGSVPQMRSPIKYHVFVTVAFVTIIMTYFGVNYFLGGMHSYA